MSANEPKLPFTKRKAELIKQIYTGQTMNPAAAREYGLT